MDVLRRLVEDAAIARLAAAVRRGGPIAVRGSSGSSTTIMVGALSRALGSGPEGGDADRGAGGPGARARPVILMVVGHLDDADEALDELEACGISAARLPAMELLPGESALNLELLAERLSLVKRLIEGEAPAVLVASMASLMQSVPRRDQLSQVLRAIRVGDRVDSTELAAWLVAAGYARVESIDASGEFAVRGGIIDVFPPGGVPARLDLFGDQVEAIHEIDLGTMGSDRRVDRTELVGATVERMHSDEGVHLTEHLPEGAIAVLCEVIELTEQGRSYFDRAADTRGIFGPPAVMQAIASRCSAVIEANQLSAGSVTDSARWIDLPVARLRDFAENAGEAIDELIALASGHTVVVFCQNEGERQRMLELLAEHAAGTAVAATVTTQYLHRGFIWGGGARPLALVPYAELLHRYQTRRRIRRLGGGGGGRALDSFLDLSPGDIVVHRDHGLARFAGLHSMAPTPDKPAEEFLTLEFAGSAKLHVPATRIELVQKYIGAFKGEPELSTLGGKRWARQKEKVSEAVRDLAGQMLRIQAARESMPGIRFPADTPWQREFEAEFPYEETDDQRSAIAAMKHDMSGTRPMDRLICGDVGFGKTEIAIRAAFKAAEFGKQVAVLVPTTVLAEQHERTFTERFADYPFRVESISRFKTGKEQKDLLDATRRGQVDIIIGTHRLLSKDVRFADLGLVIIDEEQRFGVEHKQKLLELRATVDVLTLSATPIPRTLHMAMLGLRDISSLTTAPLDRRAIVTEVIPYSERRISQAIDRELAREGQIFFVHNRVFNIESVADEVQALAPDARVIVGHGQMPARKLESVMLKFMRRQADILVCTTIIESGIDIPTANTMFINDAHMFGLSDLHQLRGRVGRYKHRAYCYLLLPRDRTISDVAVKRLRAIESFSMLGAGFKIALRDLEIRGAGNLLGAEQSGHIAAVGYEMYCQLLEHAVAELKDQKPLSSVDTVIEIGLTGSLPRSYILSDARRMDAYRRISRADSYAALEQAERDLESAYGELPASAAILIQLAELRLSATLLGIRSITVRDADVILRTARPADLERHMAGIQGTLRMVGQPDVERVTEVYYRPPASYLAPESLLTVLRRRLRQPHAALREAQDAPEPLGSPGAPGEADESAPRHRERGVRVR